MIATIALIAALFSPPINALPPGFPAVDRFTSHSEACLALADELAPKKWRGVIFLFCERRSFASSRGGTVRSRVDGSPIHDRDRMWGWAFWASGVRRGALDPWNCEHHRLDRHKRHSAVERRWWSDARPDGTLPHWPFKRPRLSVEGAKRWRSHPHDAERFGTRGPHDHHHSTGVHFLGGCWPPELMDRRDVSIGTTVLRAIKICEKHGCRRVRDIRRHW